MANKKSSIKRIRQTAKKNARNNILRSACRTAEKAVRAHAEEKNKDLAMEAYKLAEKRLAKAATKGLYHKNNVSRRISNLCKLVNSL